jgi:hypothetical protein
MGDAPEQLLLPLLFPVPASGEPERKFVRHRREIVAERLRTLGLPVEEAK